MEVKPFDVTPVQSLNFSDHLNDDSIRQLVFVAELRDEEKTHSRQASFFVPTKHLSLTNQKIKSKLALKEGLLSIQLSAKSLARLVECSLEGTDVIFSDNYFDLPAGEPIEITAALPTGWTLAKARDAFKVRSIYDSYS